MYVAVSKGKVVGVCIGGRGRKKTQDGISTVLPEPTGKKYYIYLVAAKKKAHVGKALMLSHAQRARQLGFSRVYGIVTDSRMKNYVRRLGARKTLGLRNIASPSAMFFYRIPRG